MHPFIKMYCLQTEKFMVRPLTRFSYISSTIQKIYGATNVRRKTGPNCPLYLYKRSG